MKQWISDYLKAQKAAHDSIPVDAVIGLIEKVRAVLKEDRQVFVFGNGGSAANASHFATDLGKGASDKVGKRFRVLSLNDNVSWMTALANDYAYEDVFVGQMQNYGRPGDLALGLSVSGNSANCVKALEWAKKSGLHTVALVGAKRGRMAEIAEQVIVINDTHYGRVEDAQMGVCHMLCYAFMENPMMKEPAVKQPGPQELQGLPKTAPARFRGLVEFSVQFAPRPQISHVLFDFDGTLSLIRQGWPEVMVPMFVEMLPPLADETEEMRRQLCHDNIMRLNGKQTIYQMIQLAERIKQRGGISREPLWYKHEYLCRLNEKIHCRQEGLRSGALRSDDLLVYGARQFLELLQSRGLPLYLASGTDEVFVKQEADLLNLTHFFGRHIYGAVDDYKQFSKQMVIERILRENRIPGEQLLSFGDGYVEIQNTKEAGGLAVAVASDEANNGSGRFDDWKHRRLFGVGADIAIPDFRDAQALLECILAQ